jgi:hypothetical protein
MKAENRGTVQVLVSKECSINTQGLWGHGAIQFGDQGFPCSVGCEEQVNGKARYSQVFAVVKHPEHGYIAVTAKEFGELGLPECEGFPQG